MTVPYERRVALDQTSNFLHDLIDREKYPKLPKPLRDRARSLLKHYPNSFYLDIVCEKVPEYFAKNLFNNPTVYPVIITEINKTVYFKVGKNNIEYVDVLPGFDEKTEPCLSVIIYLKENCIPTHTSPIVPELNDRLKLMGEYRDVHITYRYVSTLMKTAA